MTICQPLVWLYFGSSSSTEGAENPNCHFQKAAVPTPPLPHSLSTLSLIAQVMYQKFMMDPPFARQELGDLGAVRKGRLCISGRED